MNVKVLYFVFFVCSLFLATFIGVQVATHPVTVTAIVIPTCMIAALIYARGSLLHIIIVGCGVYAGTIGIFNSIPLALIPGIQLHDMFTLGLLGVSIIALLSAGFRTQQQGMRADRYYLIFIVWAALRVYQTPVLFDAIKDCVFFALFWTICMTTRLYASHSPEHSDRAIRALFLGTLFFAGLFFAFIAAGMFAWSSAGIVHPLGRRPLALYLMIILAAGLAQWRGQNGKKQRRNGFILSIFSGLIILATFSRTVILIVALVHIPFFFMRFNRRRGRIILAFQMLFYAVAMYIVVRQSIAMDIVQDRFFYSTVRIEHGGGLSWRNMNTMGRSNVWPIIWKHALQHPIIGHGTGAARSFSTAVYGWEHPHCDYLRIFHDQGAIGLLFFCAFWLSTIRRLWKAWQRVDARDGATAIALHAALVAIIAVVLSFSTDNTIVYTYAMLPLAVLMGVADARLLIKQQLSASAMELTPS